jgi:hypothetical protein
MGVYECVLRLPPHAPKLLTTTPLCVNECVSECVRTCKGMSTV